MYDASLCSVVFGSVCRMKPSFFHLGVVLVILTVTCHRAVTYFVLYPFFRLLFGTLYPAYASYKAVRTKNVKEYVSNFLLIQYVPKCLNLEIITLVEPDHKITIFRKYFLKWIVSHWVYAALKQKSSPARHALIITST